MTNPSQMNLRETDNGGNCLATVAYCDPINVLEKKNIFHRVKIFRSNSKLCKNTRSYIKKKTKLKENGQRLQAYSPCV